MFTRVCMFVHYVHSIVCPSFAALILLSPCPSYCLSYGDGVTCVDLKVLNVPDMNGPLGPVDVKNIPL
jgi:hypothetical protein